MNRTFKEVPSFTAKWHALGLTDADLRTLEIILLKNPKIGSVIKGTGGIRKIRIPVENTGKRGGGRVLYVDIEETGYYFKGGIIMSIFKDLEKSLLEAIEMEKGQLPLEEKEDMPAPTFLVKTNSPKKD